MNWLNEYAHLLTPCLNLILLVVTWSFGELLRYNWLKVNCVPIGSKCAVVNGLRFTANMGCCSILCLALPSP
nr:hypothetical protein Q903MT_gene1722 [Picea sitchensis]